MVLSSGYSDLSDGQVLRKPMVLSSGYSDLSDG